VLTIWFAGTTEDLVSLKGKAALALGRTLVLLNTPLNLLNAISDRNRNCLCRCVGRPLRSRHASVSGSSVFHGVSACAHSGGGVGGGESRY